MRLFTAPGILISLGIIFLFFLKGWESWDFGVAGIIGMSIVGGITVGGVVYSAWFNRDKKS